MITQPNDDTAIYHCGDDTLNLELTGESSVIHAGSESGFSYGVYAEGDINISGTGSLTGITGDGTTFSPGAACTRAQMVTFLWRCMAE